MCAVSFTPARGDAILSHVRALYRLACRLEDMDELNHRDGANYDDPNLKAAIRSIYRKITSEERKLPRRYRPD